MYICPKCKFKGARILNNIRYCGNCGTEMIKEVEIQPKESNIDQYNQQKPTNKYSEDVYICPKCNFKGYITIKNKKYCAHCKTLMPEIGIKIEEYNKQCKIANRNKNIAKRNKNIADNIRMTGIIVGMAIGSIVFLFFFSAFNPASNFDCIFGLPLVFMAGFTFGSIIMWIVYLPFYLISKIFELIVESF